MAIKTETIEIGRHGKKVPVQAIRRALRLHPIKTLDDVKAAGRELKNHATMNDFPLKHSEALEAIAKQLGHDSFPALQVKLNGGSHAVD